MNTDERDAVAAQFGVSVEQVERDHLISHLLAFLSREFRDRVHFIGGTALARTHLPNGRLSEDVDLIAVGNRQSLARDLDAALPRALARTHGRMRIEPVLSQTADAMPVLLRPSNGVAVQIQLLSGQGRIGWPTEHHHLIQRFSDAPPAQLSVPTLPAFAASKTATWSDRRAARDLWDLWALSRLGAISADAGRLYRRHGPTNRLPAPHLFTEGPSEAEWQSQLAGQTRLSVSANGALAAVRNAWGQVAQAD